MNTWISRIGITAVALAAAACGSAATGGAGGAAATATGAGGAEATSTGGVGGDKSSTATGALATGSTGSGEVQPPAQKLYGSSIHNLTFEIDYVTGAEPYTGAVLGFGEVWDVAQTNVERLFQGSNKVFDIPRTLDKMEKLTDVTGADFTVDQILAIASKHRNQLSSGDTATFYFVWLDGYYRDATGVNKDVLGVSLGTTGVLAMFKPVIAGTGSGAPGLNVEHYVEQATIVHEFGHAAGLVNNGLAQAAAHDDAAHEGHCTNQDCVMYWAIEGTGGAISYVQKSLLASNTILYGKECLDDAAKATAP
jgi:predicted Zn-dependent protease